MNEKLIKYFHYFKEYLKHGDVLSILDSANYILFKKGSFFTRTTNSYLGKMKIRKGTNDFQFINLRYEWGVKKFVIDNSSNHDYFFDVGAGIGDYSFLCAKKGMHVIAFEPIAHSVEIFKHNITQNEHASKIKIFDVALGDKNCKTEFIETSVNTGASHRYDIIHEVRANEKDLKQEVEVRSLDSFNLEKTIPEESRILMKIDIEGMEPEAIQGAKNFLTHFKNITMILEEKHSGKHLISNALKEVGNFEIRRIDEFNICAIKKN